MRVDDGPLTRGHIMLLSQAPRACRRQWRRQRRRLLRRRGRRRRPWGRRWVWREKHINAVHVCFFPEKGCIYLQHC